MGAGRSRNPSPAITCRRSDRNQPRPSQPTNHRVDRSVQVIDDEANVLETERISQIFENMSQRYARSRIGRALAMARAFELLLRRRDVKLVKPYIAVTGRFIEHIEGLERHMVF
jgi:hypothetical protein